ncbi:uncharacterized protein TNCV_4011611 [Trichonephila clavipes]|nr:uncharacterized protein TNCV_4011611 [Trichonephila clavipes]
MCEKAYLFPDKLLTCLDPVDLTASVISAVAVELLLLQNAVVDAGAITASVADKRVRIAAVEIANVAERQNAEFCGPFLTIIYSLLSRVFLFNSFRIFTSKSVYGFLTES